MSLTSLSQGEFLVNNYKQAINILNGEAVFVKQMHDQNIANVSVFQDWLAEEKAYLEGLSREPLQKSLTMEYWQKLVNLAASEYVIFFLTLCTCRPLFLDAVFRPHRALG
jgi:hypothetical protein